MRNLLILFLLLSGFKGIGQANQDLLERSKAFHKALITNSQLSSFLDDELSYGHSNGWLESKEQLMDHINSKMMVYKTITEDSLLVTTDGDIGYLRFFTNLIASLNGSEASYRLKVLEVWRKKEGVWVLFARQAIRAM